MKQMRRSKDDDSASQASSSKNMVVAVRIRPLSQKETESGHHSCCSVLNNNIVTIKKDGQAGNYLKSQQGSLNEYGFDAAFDDSSSQLDVYENTAKPFIPNVIDGYNVTVFAYGATGAGKTHTMMGNARCDAAAVHSEAGIIPNSLVDIFKLIAHQRQIAERGEHWNVSMSYLEVYNEQVYDLLEPTGKVLYIREDQERGVVAVAGLAEKIVDAPETVLDLLQYGNRHRKTEATMANQVSSRSHAVLQLTVKHTRRTESGHEHVVESKLSLIDLAGSERASATCNRGSRLQEGANINKSLLALANCINALAGNSTSAKRMNVKYRDSKLTHLLKSSLEGKCNLIMIANINPSHVTFEDSHNTLKYANRAKNIKVNPQLNDQVKESNWMERELRLRDENAMLRARVAELENIIINFQNGNVLLPSSSSSALYEEPADMSVCIVDASERMEVTQMDVSADEMDVGVSSGVSNADKKFYEDQIEKLIVLSREQQLRIDSMQRDRERPQTSPPAPQRGRSTSPVLSGSKRSMSPTRIPKRSQSPMTKRRAPLADCTNDALIMQINEINVSASNMAEAVSSLKARRSSRRLSVSSPSLLKSKSEAPMTRASKRRMSSVNAPTFASLDFSDIIPEETEIEEQPVLTKKRRNSLIPRMQKSNSGVVSEKATSSKIDVEIVAPRKNRLSVSGISTEMNENKPPVRSSARISAINEEEVASAQKKRGPLSTLANGVSNTLFSSFSKGNAKTRPQPR